MHKINLWPKTTTISIDENTTLLDALKHEKIFIRSSCGGYATCGECIVKIVGGEDNLVPPAYDELKLLGNVFHITKERLSCQCRVRGDVSIDRNDHDKYADSATNSKKNPHKRVIVKKKTPIAGPSDEYEAALEEAPVEQAEVKVRAPLTKESRLGGGKRPRFFQTGKRDE